MNVRLNLWQSYEYHDPAEVLRRLRQIESELADVELDPRLRALRTPGLKKYREWRDAAVFTYGMGLARGTPMFYATQEAADYDFVTAWEEAGQANYCAVQLKELPPESLNEKATLTGLVASLERKYAPTDTALVIKLNRKPEIDLVGLRLPNVKFREVYLFWANAIGSAHWILYGDLKREPGGFEFDYPE